MAVKFPEHEKAAQCDAECVAISEFLDYLAQRGIVLASRHTHNAACSEMSADGCGLDEDRLYDVPTRPAELIAGCFGINRGKLEREKRDILALHRNVANPNSS